MTEIYEVGPKKLPVEWDSLDAFGPAGWRYVRKDGLRVITTIGPYEEYGEWLHVSFSREKSIPSYQDMVDVKELFIGGGRKAIMVLPPRSEHVNIHPNCLHLWCCLSHDPLPDFTMGTGMI